MLVYAELNEGKVATTSLELMAKARELGDVYAVALGSGAKAAAAVLGKHGAKAVHVNEDAAFDDYIAEPATDALAALHEQQKPDLILFGFTPDSREVAGRLAARLGTGLISNAGDVSASGGGFVAKVPYFGGAKIASMKANGKPAIILVRPKSFEASESGGAADVKQLDVKVAPESKRAHVTERVVEASEKVKLEDARVVISGGRGMGGPQNFPLLDDLASALGGAVGASRAVVDAGWVPYRQVGAARCLHRGRHLGRDAAHSRHEDVEDHHRHQQGCRGSNHEDGGPGSRGGRVEDRARTHGRGQSQKERIRLKH